MLIAIIAGALFGAMVGVIAGWPFGYAVTLAFVSAFGSLGALGTAMAIAHTSEPRQYTRRRSFWR